MEQMTPMQCGLCGEYMPGYGQDVVVRDGDATLTMLCCGECRRSICTCGTCSAYNGGACCAHVPRALGQDGMHLNDRVLMSGAGWCRDGWEQRRILDMEEVRERLGERFKES